MDKRSYRLMVKNEKGRFMPVWGIDELTGNPIFVTNVIHGLCFWNQTDESIKYIADKIKTKYPAIEFELRKD